MIESKTNNEISSFWIKHRVVVSVVLIILTAVFLFVRADNEFQVDSETLVVDPILMDLKDIRADFGAFGLGCIDDDDEVYPIPLYTEFLKPGSDMNEYFHCYRKYSSQTGLQGFVFRGIAHVVRTTAIIGILRFLCCLLLVIVLYLITVNLKRKYSLSFAAAFWAVAFVSPYLISFSPNLYWVSFTWYLPMLLGLISIMHPDHRKWIYPLFFLAVLIKCMCGYEYVSTIMLSGIAFQTVEWLTGVGSRKNGFKCIFLSGVSMLLGFVAALLIHAFVLGKEFYNGNLLQGLSFIKDNLVNKRTFGSAADFDGRLSNSLNASIWDVLKIYFWESAYSKCLLASILVVIVIVVLDRMIFKKDGRVQLVLVAVQLAAVLSWLILAKSHSFDHRHINFVLFDLGLTQTCLYCILKAFSNHIKIGISKEIKQDKPSYGIIFRFEK
ncbi:MAG: hypothetical protein J5777_04050 [Clostridiales bacterium]|nr:hypothetical protein [Clostridiales bacterium]